MEFFQLEKNFISPEVLSTFGALYCFGLTLSNPLSKTSFRFDTLHQRARFHCKSHTNDVFTIESNKMFTKIVTRLKFRPECRAFYNSRRNRSTAIEQSK